MNVWERKKRNSSRKIIENIGAVLVEHKEALDAPEQEYWWKKAADGLLKQLFAIVNARTRQRKTT